MPEWTEEQKRADDLKYISENILFLRDLVHRFDVGMGPIIFNTNGRRRKLILNDLPSEEHAELWIDAARMVNKIFEDDSEWLKKMCEEELKQREINADQNTHI